MRFEVVAVDTVRKLLFVLKNKFRKRVPVPVGAAAESKVKFPNEPFGCTLAKFRQPTISLVAVALCQLLGVDVDVVMTVGDVGNPVKSARATPPFLPTSVLGMPGVAALAGLAGANGNPATFKSNTFPSLKTANPYLPITVGAGVARICGPSGVTKTQSGAVKLEMGVESTIVPVLARGTI